MRTADHSTASLTSLSGAPKDSLAVLISGGLDSAILLGEALYSRPVVFPLYVRQGLFWESVELQYLKLFLDALCCSALRPLTILEMPVEDIYGQHWSVTGSEVPGADTPDDAVFLPGRNVLLLAKAILWCHVHQVPEVALAPLEANPFPDATPHFFDAFEHLVNQAVAGHVHVVRPYAHLAKSDVMRRGQSLPLQFTFSCMRPVDGKHCGTCNKCAERRHAFASAGLSDPTEYFEQTLTRATS